MLLFQFRKRYVRFTFEIKNGWYFHIYIHIHESNFGCSWVRLRLWWAVTTLLIIRLYKEKTFHHLRHIHQCISSSLKGNMFACDQCQFKSGTKGILKIHITNLQEDIKYACDSCDHQTSTKTGLASHQEAIHKQKKYPCREKGRSTHAGNVTAIHEGKRYACRSFDHQASSKSNLTKHRKKIHEG